MFRLFASSSRVEDKKIKNDINRLLEDYTSKLPEMRNAFNKKNREAEAILISRNLTISSIARNSFKNILIEFQKIIDDSLKELIRNIEDILLKNYGSQDLNKIKEFEEENEKLKILIEQTNNLRKEFEKDFEKRNL